MAVGSSWTTKTDGIHLHRNFIDILIGSPTGNVLVSTYINNGTSCAIIRLLQQHGSITDDCPPSRTREKISWLEHKPNPDQQDRDDLLRMRAELDRRLAAVRDQKKDAGK